MRIFKVKRIHLKSLRYGLIAFGSLILFTGCANVKFYKDENLTQQTGLKYYIAKPYLLVSYTGNKDNPVKVEVIQLPDMEHPNFAEYKPGWGSHEFTLSLTNGILTQYGQKADSKGPETIKAFADLASEASGAFGNVATGVKTLAEARRLESAQVDQSIASVKEAIGSLNAIVTMKDEDLGVFAEQRTLVSRMVKDLQVIQASLPTSPAEQIPKLEAISKRITDADIKNATGIPAASAIDAFLSNANTSVAFAIKTLKEIQLPTASKPDFELFEIRTEGGTTILKRVKEKETLKILPQGSKQSK